MWTAAPYPYPHLERFPHRNHADAVQTLEIREACGRRSGLHPQASRDRWLLGFRGAVGGKSRVVGNSEVIDWKLRESGLTTRQLGELTIPGSAVVWAHSRTSLGRTPAEPSLRTSAKSTYRDQVGSRLAPIDAVRSL